MNLHPIPYIEAQRLVFGSLNNIANCMVIDSIKIVNGFQMKCVFSEAFNIEMSQFTNTHKLFKSLLFFAKDTPHVNHKMIA